MFVLDHVIYKDVLDIPSMDIVPSKITCILGQSGGGKTTLLRLLAKLLSPEKGRILFEDRDLEEIDSIAHRKRVVMLSQKPHLFPGTVEDNLQMGLRYHGKTLDAHALKDSLIAVRLDKKLTDDVEHFSVGEAQRLALARVMVLDADVVLLDEPSSALDEDTERFVIDSVASYARKHDKTLVMVTHSRRVAETYADVVYTIDHGSVKGRVEHGN